MKLNDLTTRIDQLIEQARGVLATRKSGGYIDDSVDSGKLTGLKASVLSFVTMTYGKNHSHYTVFDTATDNSWLYNAEQAYEILLSIKKEIDGGWVFSVKQLISAEIFADFVEMAEHLLEQGYKDPAAVMIGSVLEENLRQLCADNGIDIELEKGDKRIPKKADRLNSDLAGIELYSKLDQKAVTMWLDLRNKAAHGKYSEYSKDQVQLMAQGVLEFLARINN